MTEATIISLFNYPLAELNDASIQDTYGFREFIGVIGGERHRGEITYSRNDSYRKDEKIVFRHNERPHEITVEDLNGKVLLYPIKPGKNARLNMLGQIFEITHS